MAKAVAKKDVIDAEATPPSVKYAKLTDEQLEEQLAKELEECSKLDGWPDTDRY